MEFYDKFRILRTSSHMSQEMVASKLDVSRQTVSKWESGCSYPEIDKLIAISELFDVSIDYMLKSSEFDSANSGDDLDRVVIRFLGSSQKLNEISKELVEIAEDGIITDDEKVKLRHIDSSLEHISKNINAIRSTIQKALND